MNAVVDRIVDIMVDTFALPREELTPEVDFDSLNLDSLVLTELSVILENRYGVPVAEAEVAAARTVGGVAQLLLAKGVPA